MPHPGEPLPHHRKKGGYGDQWRHTAWGTFGCTGCWGPSEGTGPSESKGPQGTSEGTEPWGPSGDHLKGTGPSEDRGPQGNLRAQGHGRKGARGHRATETIRGHRDWGTIISVGSGAWGPSECTGPKLWKQIKGHRAT